MKITIIGSGNIGSALITGLLRDKTVTANNITVTDPRGEALTPFVAKGVNASQNNIEAVKSADMVILCVKPYLVRPVIEEILTSLKDDTLLVSLAAGITLNQLELYAGKRSLFRVIPNTAMAVNQSMTCIAVNDIGMARHSTVIDLFAQVGKAVLVDESLMNAATVIASCGTAFALRYLRAAMTGAVEIGLRPDIAKEMIIQTMAGAAAMMTESNAHPEEEIDKVTTPKGITIKGLNEMEHAGFTSAVMRGILAAYKVME